MLHLFSKKSQKIAEKLKESEIRYRRLFESAKDGILILDFESGEIVDANPYILNIIDNNLNEVIGKKLWEIGLFRNKLQSKLAFLELKSNGYIRFEDMPIQGLNGKITEVEFVCNVYFVNYKRVIQCNIRNISERKQFEKKQELMNKILLILNSEDHWKFLIKNILIEIMKYTGMETVGIRLKESNKDNRQAEGIGFPEYFIKTENHFYKRNKEGDIVFDDKDNHCIKCMSGMVISGQTDPSLPYITKGGSFYSNNTSELLTSRNKKENQTPISGQCNTEASESVAFIPLYSGKKIIGLLQMNDKHPDMFTLEAIDFFEKLGNSIGIAFNRIQNENKIKESEQILKTQNEDFFDLNQKYSVLNQELSNSINHIQNINEELLVAKSKAEESDRLKSTFLANMSHEIRSPMNAILGFSEFLLQPDLSHDKLVNFVQIINASGMQLMSVISDIIDISKIEADQIIVNIEFVDINILMNELFVVYERLAGLKKLSLHCTCKNPNEHILIETDGNRVKQVICNLLNNAIKFTKEGSIEFGYEIVEIRGRESLQFYVKDTGIGIAPENHALIFERFRQVEITAARNYSGNGLGLPISKALVEKLGGSIMVNSEPGNGSTFSFTIPYIHKNEDFVKSVPEFRHNESLNWHQKTILIVEDEVNSYVYFEELLSETNVKILHAWDGMQALEYIKDDSDISLILMDIKMPVIDGYEATQLIKQIRPKLPIIAQTASGLSNERNNALEAGCDQYLTKPINRDLFMEVVGSYLL